MKKSVSTQAIVDAYNVLKDAKFVKLDDGDKIKVWKISRTLKPIFNQFIESKEDATKTFFTEEVVQSYQKLKAYEDARQSGSESLPMTEEEYKAAALEFLKSKAVTEKALAELLQKEVELEFEPITEQALAKLMDSNDWTLKEVELLDFIVE